MKKILTLVFILISICGFSQLKLSNMITADPLQPTDLFLVTQNGVSKKAPYSLFSTSFTGNQYELFSSDGAGGVVANPGLLWNGNRLSLVDAYNNSILGYQSGNSITTGNNNVFLGYQSGFSQTNATNNVFIGYQSGYDNVSAGSNTFVGSASGTNNTSGSSNTYLGHWSGFFNLTGNQNVFIGDRAGYQNTSGAYNVIAGYQAGYTNNGSYNSFYGYKAGYSNTTGTLNVFLGDKAGEDNTTGYYNTFTGGSAGSSNIGAINNTFTGYNSGAKTTSGGYNTFLGSYSGFDNTTGTNNTFVGYNSGADNATGIKNVYVGQAAGRVNIDGNQNTALGFEANEQNPSSFGNLALGYNAGRTATADSCVYIGNNVGYSNSVSNRIFIDNYNSTSNPLLLLKTDSDSVIVNGNVRITGGVDVPAAAAGNNYEIQFNLNDTLSSSPNFTWDGNRLNIVADSGVNNIFIGESSGENITDGTSNITLGKNTGSVLTGGDFNVLIGNNAGKSLLTSQSSTMIGYNSGNLTIGGENTFIGSRSGNSNITGQKNVYIGVETGHNTLGDNNVFMGYQAGYTNTGSSNVFLGYQAGRQYSGSNKLYIENSNSSTPLIYGEFDNDLLKINGTFRVGDDLEWDGNTLKLGGGGLGASVYIGESTGELGISATDNTFIGVETGIATVSPDGIKNTFIGSYNGRANTSGSNNIFLGHRSGNNNTTGSYNVYLGNFTGNSNATGSNNVFLGDSSGFSETGSNKLYIENSNSTTPLIYGEFDNDKLVFNTDTTISRGHIKGDSTIIAECEIISLNSLYGNAYLPTDSTPVTAATTIDEYYFVKGNFINTITRGLTFDADTIQVDRSNVDSVYVCIFYTTAVSANKTATVTFGFSDNGEAWGQSEKSVSLSIGETKSVTHKFDKWVKDGDDLKFVVSSTASSTNITVNQTNLTLEERFTSRTYNLE